MTDEQTNADFDQEALDARMKALRGDGQERRNNGLPIWAMGLIAIGLAAVVAIFSAGGELTKRLTGAEVDEYQSGAGSPVAALPAGDPIVPPQIVISEIQPDPEAEARRLAMENQIAALNARIEELMGAATQGGDVSDEATRLIEELRAQNAEVLRQLAAERERAASALANQAEMIEARMSNEIAMLRAELNASRANGPVGPTAEELRLAEAEAARLAFAEEQRRIAEERANAQINSEGLIFDQGAPVGGLAALGAGGADNSPTNEMAGPGRPPNADEAFFASASQASQTTTVAGQLPYPSDTIVQGTIVLGVLETSIDSSLPGAIRAAVSLDVWSYDGQRILMPKGTRLIGSYRSDLDLAQERALVVWERAITPAGASMELGSFGADRLGRSGIAGSVDTHFVQRFGSAALISIIGAVPGIAVAENGTTEPTGDAAVEVGEDFRDATSDVISEYLRIQPTIHVDQGSTISVFVGRDLVIFDG